MCSSLCDTIFPCLYARVRIRDGSTSLISSHTSPAHTLHPIHFPSSRRLRHTFAQGFLVQDSGAWVYIQDSRLTFPKRSYQLDNTVSHQICAVKQAWAELVLGLVTTRESSVTLFFCSPCANKECLEISESPCEEEGARFRRKSLAFEYFFRISRGGKVGRVRLPVPKIFLSSMSTIFFLSLSSFSLYSTYKQL